MRKIISLIVVCMVIMGVSAASPAFSASISGVVTDGSSLPVFNAHVSLKRVPGPGGPPQYFMMTDSTGEYAFTDVDPGSYRIKAHKPGYGTSFIIIPLPPEAVEEMNFQLPGDGSQLPPPLPLIETEGYAIVETGPQQSQYFLDEDNDGEPEYHLGFGPPWYQPVSGAERPNDGDFIEITGGLMEHPVLLDNIIVYEINGLLWRQPGPPLPPGGGGNTFNSSEIQPRHFIEGINPNPFNPTTEIRYQLSESAAVNIAVYNVAGQLVAELVDGRMEAGQHSVIFDADNLPSGIYFTRMQTDNMEQTRKIMLIK